MQYKNFQPQETIWATAKNAITYLNDHRSIVWATIKYYLPLLAPFMFLMLSFDYLYNKESLKPFAMAAAGIGMVGKAYIMPFLAITWHRIVLHGVDDFVYANPLKPKGSELRFLIFGIAIMGLALFFTIVSTLVTGASAKVIGGFSLVLVTGALAYFGFYLPIKASFYFPNVASESGLTLKECMKLMKGFFWKVIWTIGLTSFAVMIAYIIVLLIPLGVISVLGTIIQNPDLLNVLELFIEFPIQLILEPISYILGVIVLSNYFAVARK